MTKLDFSDLPASYSQTASDIVVAIAAGARAILLTGCPSIGKTQIARRIPGLLPPIDDRGATWLRAEYEGMGLGGWAPSSPGGPFRAPHHSITTPALVGGMAMRHAVTCNMPRNIADRCNCTRPAIHLAGEVHLVRFGVLMLDEIHEFTQDALASLACTLHRMGDTAPLVVATSSPCPCGRRDVGGCTCTREAQGRLVEVTYKACRLLGSNRILTDVAMPSDPNTWGYGGPRLATTAVLRARVLSAGGR